MIMKKCVINTKTDSIIVFIAPNGCIGLVTIGIPRILMDKVLRISNYLIMDKISCNKSRYKIKRKS